MNLPLANSAQRSRTYYVPRFALYLGEREASTALLHDVIEVVYRDHLDKIATFELTVNNWDAESRQFKHLDSPSLDPNQTVRLHMGYLDDSTDHRLASLPFMLQGTITELRCNFPAAGRPTLSVTGQNLLHRFRKKKVSDIYQEENATASRIARRICERLNVGFVGDGEFELRESQFERRMQTDQYDIEFLVQVARADGYDVVIEDQPHRPALKFIRTRLKTPDAMELRYGAGLIEFQPTLDTTKQVTAVVIQGWDQARGLPINVRVGVGDLAGGAGLDSKLLTDSAREVGERTEVVTNAPVKNAQAARAYAESLLTRINQEAVTGVGRIVGTPELRAGTELVLWGLGRRYSGRYFVTATTHTLGTSGYTTQFECRLTELLQDRQSGGRG